MAGGKAGEGVAEEREREEEWKPRQRFRCRLNVVNEV